jgi:hypothetical protein
MGCGEVCVRVKHVETIKLLTLSHLVGSLPFTMFTMHGHMNIKINQVTSVFEVNCMIC